MSLNPLVAESLFQEDLYQIPGKVLIIIPVAWDAVTQEEKSILTKILAALKLNLETVQIISRSAVAIETLLPFSPAQIISFGVSFQPEVKSYETVIVNDIKVICADALHMLDDQKKRNLWLALRSMFGI
jgi:hypothetical protein